MKAKYDGRCEICNKEIQKGDDIYWDQQSKDAIHATCAEKVPDQPASTDPTHFTDDDPIFKMARRNQNLGR